MQQPQSATYTINIKLIKSKYIRHIYPNPLQSREIIDNPNKKSPSKTDSNYFLIPYQNHIRIAFEREPSRKSSFPYYHGNKNRL